LKVKEYPLSLYSSWRLLRLSCCSLHEETADDLPVVVSLTSIPSRLKTLHLTIRSLLAQECKPEKIVLWLNDDLKNSLPETLVQLEGRRFEIRYSPLTCSHRKLIHSLEAFPDDVIVTCDDDSMYDAGWLGRLWVDHRKFPDSIITHRCRKITYGDNDTILPYAMWPIEREGGATYPELMPVGYGGVLYPPRSLMGDVCKSELFLKLTPKADDLWFKAMSFLQGTQVRKSLDPGMKPIPIIRTQGKALKNTNIKLDQNKMQWEALCRHYAIRFKGSA